MKTLLSLLIVTCWLSPATADDEPLGPISAKELNARRSRAVERMRSVEQDAAQAFLLLRAPQPDHFAGDVDYLYRPDNNLFYLTGVEEDRCALLLSREPLDGGGHALLFVTEGDARSRVWTGARLTRAEASERSGIPEDSVLPLEELPARLLALLGSRSRSRSRAAPPARLWYDTDPGFAPGKPASGSYRFLTDTLGSRAYHLELSSPGSLLHPLRQIKSPAEIARMRKAIDTTCFALKSAIRSSYPGIREHELRGVIEGTFLRRGCSGWGFPSIVGSGPNSCILHYQKYARAAAAGEVILMDVGAEFSCYSADITRTIPVSGRFTERQREVYSVVLEAQKAAIAEIRPGVSWRNVNATARRVSGEGLVRLGIIDDQREVRRYFLHGTSHGLGLAVHDPMPETTLAAGMVITVEPGIYLPEEALGIRIEDDVLVTKDGHEVLSAALPKEIAEIEALMASRDF